MFELSAAQDLLANDQTVMCNTERMKRIPIILLILFTTTFSFSQSDSLEYLKRAIHNGLIISPLGTFTDQVNGISFSLWMSMGKKINGLSFNLLWNFYEQINGISIGFVNHTAMTKGIQIGLVNKTKKLRGFQFGLWNKNERRSLPIINWNFNNKESAAHNK